MTDDIGLGKQQLWGWGEWMDLREMWEAGLGDSVCRDEK